MHHGPLESPLGHTFVPLDDLFSAYGLCDVPFDLFIDIWLTVGGAWWCGVWLVGLLSLAKKRFVTGMDAKNVDLIDCCLDGENR